MNHQDKISLTELQGLIRDKIYEHIPGTFWVTAEIAEMKIHSAGHCYLELTDSDKPGGKIVARVRATIWASKFSSLNTFFTASTGIPLRQGISILCKATVEYHEIYGISLNISDIDPAYTAGDLALRREAIIRRLTAEGVMEMNRGLNLPPYPRHIAVISSSKAAGYHDFINHLTGNSYRYIFKPELFESVMQGELTENSVIEALNLISEQAERFDAVVIIRGGGSATDLSWFDSYNIAYHVTQFPLPVLTGIGHEKDLSVTDMVAWKSLKTPTAVADFLLEKTVECENRIIEMAGELITAVNGALSSAGEQLSSLRNRMASTARLTVRVKSDKLAYHTETLRRVAVSGLRSGADVADRLGNTLRHLDPAGVLKRGFTLTSKNGTIIRSPEELKPGDDILTHFETGQALSTIKGITQK